MKSVFVLLSILYAVSADDVVVLTDSDFSSVLANHELALVEFYAPWCGHCKKLAPEYEKAATKLKNAEHPVTLAKVDCTAEKDTCSKFGVSGYPTLKIFRNGELAEDYNGPREADGIVKLMKSKAGPTSTLLESVEQAEKFLSTDEYAVIMLSSATETDATKTFQKVADSLSSELRFAHTSNADVLKKYGDKGITLFRPKQFQSKFEDAVINFKNTVAQDAVKNWVRENMIGLCAHRTQSNADSFKRPLFVAYYDVDYVRNEKGTNYWRNRVMKVGKKLKDAGKNVFFAISDRSEMSRELGECGLEPSASKPVVCGWDSRERKFSMSAEFGMDTFEQFINDVLADKLEPYLKSEPLPDNEGVALKTVVAKNFDEIVNNEDKDVLIEFYAPWCGHCKTLAPKYEELAEKLKDEPEITIAKMDATANDVNKPYEVSGFPTLYFAPKGKKGSPLRYNGGREVDDFVKYLAKEATNELKGYKRNGKKKKTEL